MRRPSNTITWMISASSGLCLAALACGGAPPAPSEPVAPSVPVASSPPPAQAAPTASGDDACSVDADCEPVELGCCDHCNGGSLGAFNRAQASKHRPTCGPTRCTRRGCGAATARCTNQHCVAGVE